MSSDRNFHWKSRLGAFDRSKKKKKKKKKKEVEKNPHIYAYHVFDGMKVPPLSGWIPQDLHASVRKEKILAYEVNRPPEITGDSYSLTKQ
jgi:hypothetical protein